MYLDRLVRVSASYPNAPWSHQVYAHINGRYLKHNTPLNSRQMIWIHAFSYLQDLTVSLASAVIKQVRWKFKHQGLVQFSIHLQIYAHLVKKENCFFYRIRPELFLSCEHPQTGTVPPTNSVPFQTKPWKVLISSYIYSYGP